MRYLQHTKDYGICFYATHPLPTPFLFGYSDADWGGDQETLQSTSGFVYLLARGSISWQSKKQDRVTLSSTEAEYVAMTLALKEGIWLKHLLMETTLFANQPLRLLCDNMSAIMLARNLKHSEKTKHIAMKLQFIRELIQEGTIELTHVRSDQQLADFLTKSIPKAKHLESCQQLGICNLNYQLKGKRSPVFKRSAEENLAEEKAVIVNKFDLRWFTPRVEADICGHATLASAHLLFSSGIAAGDTIIFHTRSGVLKAKKISGYEKAKVPDKEEENSKDTKVDESEDPKTDDFKDLKTDNRRPIGVGVVELEFSMD
ncbi:hypothetical protein L7F22_054775 [Adiantum nelumboides]|nr:hypothetical protein [Adiantum nelumboides]